MAKAKEMETATAKAENLAKEKAKENLMAKVVNALLVMAQVWDQAPAQTMVDKAMVLEKEIAATEKENHLKEAKVTAKVEKAMNPMKTPKSAEIVEAQAVKHP
tara:strand:- start:175 stop:483 length:309 start_codon:yes stop_codon:yes gene_type:complete